MVAYKWGFDMVGVNSVHSLSLGSWGPDVVILMEEEDARPPEFYFSSQHLNDLTVPGEIRGRAMKLKTLLDGALLMIAGYGFRPEPMREMWAMDHFSRRGAPEPDMSVSTFSATLCARPLSRIEEGIVARNLLEASIFTARTDLVVRDILNGLGTNGITWISLYALIDTMKTNGTSEEAQAAAAGVTMKEFRRFKHTANSFGAVGVAARHGHTRDAVPPDPMTLERGAAIMLAATRGFVRKRNVRALAAAKIVKLDATLVAETAAAVSDPAPARTDGSPPVVSPVDDSVGDAARTPVATAILAAVALAVPAIVAGLFLRRRARR